MTETATDTFVPTKAEDVGATAAEVRAWAVNEGLEVSASGRIASTVLVAFNER